MIDDVPEIPGYTIEHLLGVNVDVGLLPDDGGSGTFDTTGASLFLSSDQIEQYLKLGRSAIDEMFERQAALNKSGDSIGARINVVASGVMPVIALTRSGSLDFSL